MNGCDHYCDQVNNTTNPNVISYFNSSCNYSVSNDKNIIIAKGDSAATSNYWRTQDKHVLLKSKPVIGPSVTLPDGSNIQSTEEGEIPLSPFLSASAKKAAIIPQLKSSSLISLGQLADDNCQIF